MQVTDVRVRMVSKDSKMKAVVSVTFDNEFVVHDIKVIEGEKGLFIAMPSKKSAEGEYRDIAHPISSATRDMISNAILEAYDKAVAEESIYYSRHHSEGVGETRLLLLSMGSFLLKYKNVDKKFTLYYNYCRLLTFGMTATISTLYTL